IASWWRAENNANDSISGNNGQLINGTGFGSGEVGNDFNLNGEKNFVLVNPATPSSLDIGQGSGLTIEGWINPTTLPKEQLIAEYERALGTSSGSDVGVAFSIHPSSPSGILYANIIE